MNINHQNTLEGANNLLFDAVKAKAGDRLLIVGEKGENTHFEKDVCDAVLAAATAAGIDAQLQTFEVCNSAKDFPPALSEAMDCVDHTVFFSRIGDQIRFCSTPGAGSKTMCYALNADYLASDFCRIPHSLLKCLHDKLVDKISNSNEFEISCSMGTALRGSLSTMTPGSTDKNSLTAFEVGLFPQTIFPPVCCSKMTGKLILKDWLTSSSTVIYDDSVYYLNDPIIAKIDNGIITRFDGNSDQCTALEKHFFRVSEIVGGEAMAINSWHTGIIPATWYSGRVRDDLERWGSVSYASPRITHFHACGSDPGQIGINLFDASIHFDDEVIFKDGNYMFPHTDQCNDIFKDYPHWRSAFKNNADIGILT